MSDNCVCPKISGDLLFSESNSGLEKTEWARTLPSEIRESLANPDIDIHDIFNLTEELGSGCSGSVHLARFKDTSLGSRKPFALKIFFITQLFFDSKESLTLEEGRLAILRDARNEFTQGQRLNCLAKGEEACFLPTYALVYKKIYTEKGTWWAGVLMKAFGPGTTLDDLGVGSFGGAARAWMVTQIIRAIQDAFQTGVFVRDIHPWNVVVLLNSHESRPRVQLIDYADYFPVSPEEDFPHHVSHKQTSFYNRLLLAQCLSEMLCGYSDDSGDNSKREGLNEGEATDPFVQLGSELVSTIKAGNRTMTNSQFIADLRKLDGEIQRQLKAQA